MATISWISTNGGDWADAANWQGGVVPGPADDAVMDLSSAERITISTPQSVHDVSFTDPAASYVITATGALTASGDVTMDGGSIAVSGKLAASVVKLGAGGAVSPFDVLVPLTGDLVGGLALDTPPLASPADISAAMDKIVPISAVVDCGSVGATSPTLTVVAADPPVIPAQIALTAGGGTSPIGPWQPSFRPSTPPPWAGTGMPADRADAAPTVFGAGDGAVVTAAGLRREVLAAGAGNETLIAGAGMDTCVAGSGTTQMIGGSGSAVFAFANGAAGGSVTISDFAHGRDYVELRGYGTYAIPDAVGYAYVAAGSTTVTLADNTRINFAGVTDLTTSDFR